MNIHKSPAPTLSFRICAKPHKPKDYARRGLVARLNRLPLHADVGFKDFFACASRACLSNWPDQPRSCRSESLARQPSDQLLPLHQARRRGPCRPFECYRRRQSGPDAARFHRRRRSRASRPDRLRKAPRIGSARIISSLAAVSLRRQFADVVHPERARFRRGDELQELDRRFQARRVVIGAARDAMRPV